MRREGGRERGGREGGREGGKEREGREGGKLVPSMKLILINASPFPLQ